MKEKKVASLKIVFEDGSDYSVACEKGLDKDELAEYIERAFKPEPTEPLIKDEKIRKAVRAWAETVFEWGKWTENKIRVGYEGDDIYCFKIFDCLFEVPLSEKEKISDKEYTIAELCGEEEECSQQMQKN